VVDDNRRIKAGGAFGIVVASVIAAASSLLISWIAARVLTPAETAQFLVFWGVLFAIYGSLSGIQAETTRALSSIRLQGHPAHGPSALLAGLLVGGGAAVLVALTSIFWSERLLPAGHPWTVLAVVIAAVLYAGHATIAGASAGLGYWSTYSALMASESMTRLIAAVAAASLGSLIGLQYACLAAGTVWLAFLLGSPRARLAVQTRTDVPLVRQLRNHGYAVISAAATAALLVGYPVIFAATSSLAQVQQSAGILLAVQLTRAPILIPLQAFQGVAIGTFVAQRERGAASLIRPVLAIATIAAFGAVLAWLTGPWIMTTLFGDSYTVSAALLAALTGAGGAVAVLTLTGSAALAANLHRSFMAGWVASTVAAIALLVVVPGGTEVRVAASLCVAPLIGISIHLIAISRTTRSLHAETVRT